MNPISESAVAYTTTGNVKTSTPLLVNGASTAPVAGNVLIAVAELQTQTAGTGTMAGGAGTWALVSDGTTEAAQVSNAQKITVWRKVVQAGDPAGGYAYTGPAGGHGGIKVYQLPAAAVVRYVELDASSFGFGTDLAPFASADTNAFSITAVLIQSSQDITLAGGFALDAEQARGAWADLGHGAVTIAPDWSWSTTAAYAAVLVTFAEPAAAGAAPTNVTVSPTGEVTFDPATPPSGQTITGYTVTAVPTAEAAPVLAPTVSAGADAANHLAGSPFTRTAAENPNGAAITARAWTVVSGPSQVGTTIATTAALSWTPAAGTYVLRYSATNSAGTGTDDLTLTAVTAVPVISSITPGDGEATIAFSTVAGATSYQTETELVPAFQPFFVDVGGPGGTYAEDGSEVASGGVDWSAGFGVTGNTYTTPDPGQQATLAPIHQTHRYGINGQQTVSFPAAGAERVEVVLHMVEPTFGSTGKRVFSIAGPDGILVKDLDLYATVGRGVVHTVTLVVPVVDGAVTLNMAATVDNPIVAAVAVTDAAGETLTPVIAPTNPPAAFSIVYQTSLGTAPLDGVVLSAQTATIQLAPDPSIAGPVTWHVDEAVDASPAYTATTSPWAANRGNPITFAAGSHTVRAVIPLTGGGSSTSTATFQSPTTSTGGGGTGVVTDSSGVQAAPAERVARIAGINGHFEYGTYTNDTAIADKLIDIGFRHHRFHPETGNSSIVGYLGQNGVKGWATIGHSSHGTPTDVVNYLNARKQVLRDNKAYIEGLLGPNEVDNSSTRGTTLNMRDTMQALYDNVKGDSTISDLPVTSISMTWPTKSNVQNLDDMSAYVDGGDFHPYPGGYRGDDERRLPGEITAMKAILDAGTTVNTADWDYVESAARYLLATETGWHNNISQVFDHRGAPRDVAGVYGPALCVLYDRSGIARLHFYEAINQSTTGETESGIQNAFGIMDKALNYKPLAYALKNYIAIFSDPGPAFVPGKLNYTLTGPADMKHWVYQKRNGTFLIALYRNYNIWHETNQVYQEQADQTATLTLLSRNATVRTLHPYYRGGPNTTTATAPTALAANTTYTVSRVNAHLTVVEVVP